MYTQMCVRAVTHIHKQTHTLYISCLQVVVYHPVSVLPSTVEEQLKTMTSTYCLRSAGRPPFQSVRMCRCF